MNCKQRMKNRLTAERLAKVAHAAKLAKHVCENCGEHGGHWVQTKTVTLEDMILGRSEQGFWICPKLYGPDGRRLPEHTDQRIASSDLPLLMAALLG